MKKQFLIVMIFALATSALFTGCKQEQETAKKRTREYNAMVLSTATRKLYSTYSASIRGKQDVDIRTKVQGYITDIKVKEGSIVRQGQTLFVIDQVPYQAALAIQQFQHCLVPISLCVNAVRLREQFVHFFAGQDLRKLLRRLVGYKL